VFLHAGLLDSRQWERQLETCSGRFRAIAFDVRGYGRSPAPTGPFAPHEDLLGLLDALEVERAALVGNSMGGAIAIDFALAWPERTAALVLVGSALSGVSFRAYDEAQAARAEAVWERGDLEAVADVWLEVWAPLGAEGRVRELAYANTGALAHDELEEPGDPPAAGRLAKIVAPALVLVGDTEVPAISEIAARLAAELPRARLETMERADHVPNLRRPDEFDRLVLAFLDEALG